MTARQGGNIYEEDRIIHHPFLNIVVDNNSLQWG